MGVSGTWMLGADASYSVAFELTADIEVDVPSSCLWS